MKVIKGMFNLIGKLIWHMIQLVTLVSILVIGGLIYAGYIEPELLVVKEEALTTEQLTLERPLKIVQFSDLHLGPDYDTLHLARVVEKINSLDADFIMFTGDFIDDNKTFEEVNEAIEVLSKLQARAGKLAIFGNHDYGGNGHKRYKLIMEKAGFHLLVNEKQSFSLKNGEKINVYGFDDVIFGKIDVAGFLEDMDETSYNIVLVHEPDLADEVAKYPVDLQLSGHTHGGQVTFPILGPPLTPPHGKIYIKGLYDMANNNRMKLYVNVGLGTSQMKYRFLNAPEITVLSIDSVK